MGKIIANILGIPVAKAALLNPMGQVITDAMLIEEGDFYMSSEDEENVYLQLTEEE